MLLRTPGGSHLYGLAHADSDQDFFEVHPGKKRMPHSKRGQIDVTRVSLEQFLRGLSRGTPQYLEALWSRKKEIDNLPWLHTYMPNYWETQVTYLRTIKNFWYVGLETDNFKARRHAARLYLNLQSFRAYGRFNPTLTQSQVEWVNSRAMERECPTL
jgi:hypothetical protein